MDNGVFMDNGVLMDNGAYKVYGASPSEEGVDVGLDLDCVAGA